MNNTKYADDRLLIPDIEIKRQTLLQKIVKEREKNGLRINYKLHNIWLLAKVTRTDAN